MTITRGGEPITQHRVHEYLERLGIEAPPRPTLDGLRKLHRAHVHQIPFENLSIHLGEEIVLGPDELLAKIVDRHRGGFCYELNGAFASLLRALGYNVTLLAARVFNGEQLGPPFDHMTLRVDLDEPWLADAGFGGQLPIPTPPEQSRSTRWTTPGHSESSPPARLGWTWPRRRAAVSLRPRAPRAAGL